MRGLLILLLCLAAPAWATQDQWPALFDVSGVADDDVLNIRSAPDASSDIIGSLGPSDRDIEVISPNDAETWGLVNTGEGTGWVSLRFLTRQPGQWLGALPQPLFCSGTEPFWSFSYDKEKAAQFSTPDLPEQSGLITGHWPAQNRRDRHALVGQVSSVGQIGPAEIAAMLRLGQCSDGMSDRSYGIHIDLLIGDLSDARLLSGCCSLSGP
ncbi:SH3 domain-containing protein [Thalassococcus sp. S3]|uniref:SH3 domain-containing protein n=1 Tax=Thalassococcus sp. S3 TaxID=2017482 RepID=UPI0010241853|nr:SH3 domain-containing protein [Thalassococcus sp. S3]QBF34084.1 peptide-binding protein [Thalassococcus sp. S3]